MCIPSNTTSSIFIQQNATSVDKTDKTTNKVNQQGSLWENTTGGNFINFLIASETQKNTTGLTELFTSAEGILFSAALLEMRTNTEYSYRQCITPEYSDGSLILLDGSKDGILVIMLFLDNVKKESYELDSTHPYYEMLHLMIPLAQHFTNYEAMGGNLKGITGTKAS